MLDDDLLLCRHRTESITNMMTQSHVKHNQAQFHHCQPRDSKAMPPQESNAPTNPTPNQQDKSVLGFHLKNSLEDEVLALTHSRRKTMHHGTIVAGMVEDQARLSPENLHTLTTTHICHLRNMSVVITATRQVTAGHELSWSLARRAFARNQIRHLSLMAWAKPSLVVTTTATGHWIRAERISISQAFHVGPVAMLHRQENLTPTPSTTPAWSQLTTAGILLQSKVSPATARLAPTRTSGCALRTARTQGERDEGI